MEGSLRVDSGVPACLRQAIRCPVLEGCLVVPVDTVVIRALVVDMVDPIAPVVILRRTCLVGAMEDTKVRIVTLPIGLCGNLDDGLNSATVSAPLVFSLARPASLHYNSMPGCVLLSILVKIALRWYFCT